MLQILEREKIGKKRNKRKVQGTVLGVVIVVLTWLGFQLQ